MKKRQVKLEDCMLKPRNITPSEELQEGESSLKGIEDLQEEVDYDKEELSEIYRTLKGIKNLQEEVDYDKKELSEVYSTLKGIKNLHEEVDYDNEELSEVYNTLKGIKGLMEEMVIPTLGELNKIYAKIMAIKEAQEDG